jgi:transcriptional regulator with XRE-family HTH domain
MGRNPDATDRHVGKRVRMRRLMIKMSQQRLAAQLGLTFQQVQKYEKGVNRLSAGRLREMSGALGVPVQFFFDGLPELKGVPVKSRHEPSQAFVDDFLSSTDGLALAAAFVRVKNPKLRRRLVQLVKEFSDSAIKEKGRRAA